MYVAILVVLTVSVRCIATLAISTAAAAWSKLAAIGVKLAGSLLVVWKMK
jgi:hypothetical protein